MWRKFNLLVNSYTIGGHKDENNIGYYSGL